MQSIVILIQRLIVLCIGIVYSCILVAVLIARNFKHPIKFLSNKKRVAPPACLTDKNLGQHNFIHLEDVKLHYVENGQEGKPLMLLLHGFPEFWYSWRYQMKEFNKDYRVVAIDMRGYSDSDKPSGSDSYLIPTLVGDIKQLIPALGYQSCVLVGHDWGGAIAWTFATDYPELIDKLIIMNCPHPQAAEKLLIRSFSQFKKSWYVFFFQVPYLPEFLFSCYDWAVLERMRTQIMTDDDVEAYKYAMSRPGAIKAAINYYRSIFLIKRFNEKLSRIQKPTLLIWGTNDVCLDTEMATLSGDYAENFTLEFVEDGSHFVQMNRPDEVNKHMYNFLK